jgi:hypothetical protein
MLSDSTGFSSFILLRVDFGVFKIWVIEYRDTWALGQFERRMNHSVKSFKNKNK